MISKSTSRQYVRVKKRFIWDILSQRLRKQIPNEILIFRGWCPNYTLYTYLDHLALFQCQWLSIIYKMRVAHISLASGFNYTQLRKATKFIVRTAVSRCASTELWYFVLEYDYMLGLFVIFKYWACSCLKQLSSQFNSRITVFTVSLWKSMPNSCPCTTDVPQCTNRII